jgi:hypothetical protein
MNNDPTQIVRPDLVPAFQFRLEGDDVLMDITHGRVADTMAASGDIEKLFTATQVLRLLERAKRACSLWPGAWHEVHKIIEEVETARRLRPLVLSQVPKAKD